MKSVSLKLQDQILSETESLLKSIDISRNKYFNEAIQFYNQYQQRKLIEEQVKRESFLVSSDSLEVLHEFEKMDDAIQTV